MESLANYGSDDEADTSAPSNVKVDKNTGCGLEGDNYDDVQMDMSENPLNGSKAPSVQAHSPGRSRGAPPTYATIQLESGSESASKEDDRIYSSRNSNTGSRSSFSPASAVSSNEDGDKLKGDVPVAKPSYSNTDKQSNKDKQSNLSDKEKVRLELDVRHHRGKDKERSRNKDRDRDQERNRVRDRDTDRDGRKDHRRDERHRSRSRDRRDRSDRHRSRDRDERRKSKDRGYSSQEQHRRDIDHRRSRRNRSGDEDNPRLHLNNHSRKFYLEKKIDRKMNVLERLGIELKAEAKSLAGTVTPQMLVQRTMEQEAAQVKQATGVELPSYYNAAAVNPQRLVDQIQKRKLLWGARKEDPSKVVAQQPTQNKWQGATFAQDLDGKLAAKFNRLMGIKEAAKNAAAATACAGSGSEIIKKQEEMFHNMESQYEVARLATHTHRGLGLGFGTFQPR